MEKHSEEKGEDGGDYKGGHYFRGIRNFKNQGYGFAKAEKKAVQRGEVGFKKHQDSVRHNQAGQKGEQHAIQPDRVAGRVVARHSDKGQVSGER